MTVFDHYAKYYDLLYKDKDYAAEASYVLGILAEQGIHSGTLLELGSGTGKHALRFTQAGFAVDGYDLSHGMVAAANRLKQETGADMRFEVGDLRTVHTGKKYDAVVSLFHVASYQTENDGLAAMFKTAAEHLKPGGIFIFDCWYGPGVLTDPPAVRIKRLEDATCDILRIAEPMLQASRNVVDVNYTVFVTSKVDGSQVTIKELHPMRYLFEPEVHLLLAQTDLTASACFEWLTRKAANIDTWQSMFIVRAK
jgi:SAM-dependent methyltransferase